MKVLELFDKIGIDGFKAIIDSLPEDHIGYEHITYYNPKNKSWWLSHPSEVAPNEIKFELIQGLYVQMKEATDCLPLKTSLLDFKSPEEAKNYIDKNWEVVIRINEVRDAFQDL